MVLSRAQGIAAFDHVITNVFGMDDQSPLAQVLKLDGIKDISALLSLDNVHIDQLE